MKENQIRAMREAPAIAGNVPRQYPWLSGDRHCDVCVTGGGLTGAMCALTAAQAGLATVLITSDGAGLGDTGHIAGYAEYGLGRTLTGLCRTMSADDALSLYSLGLDALDRLQNLCASLDGECRNSPVASGFERRDHLLYTADPTLLGLMESEYLALKKKIPGCTLVSGGTGSAFAFDLRAGILTKDGSAVFDPYALTHLCLMKAESLGAEIFEHTAALDIQTPRNAEGCVVITTSTHRRIYADRLFFAAGSEGLHAMFRRTRAYKSFVAARRLSGDEAGWPGRCCLRTFGKRSVSCCISRDGVVAAGVRRPVRLRHAGESGEEALFSRLHGHIRNLLPSAEGTPAYEYACSCAAAYDGMPVIGAHKGFRNCFFALSGSAEDAALPVFAAIAASAAGQMLQGKSDRIPPHFDPMRL